MIKAMIHFSNEDVVCHSMKDWHNMILVDIFSVVTSFDESSL